MIELQLIMTEAAGWPEDDRVVIDVLMQQWEEENEALRAAGEERGA